MYTTEDHAAILRSIPGNESIQAKVAEIQKEFGYRDDVTTKGPDPKDKDNADAWVPRNPWMNRLTGIHPFNSEAPLSLLQDHGFLTPPTLHYVRNHGVCPKLSWHTHKIDISGLVNRPMKITMAELVRLPTVTVPVTLQCAGNRRKEQNLIQKGIGFHWGCAAASTSIWTGVPLRALLEHVGIKEKDEGANWINFDSPEGEVQLGDTRYGASHSREACLNPARPCMLAFLQNGQPLHPDHGYPVRLLMPGYIGGRMIKWVTRISVTEQEGANHYHIYDNRVFPKHITSKEEATKYKIWTDPAYTINDRNINSAIWAPAHCEKLSLSVEEYQLSGYAYNGAGRPVHRIEVTLNGGRSWRPAKILRFEKPNEYGMYYCWVHWRVEVPTGALQACGEFAVRAWDDSQNCQPERPNWNLMGMMNNNWFRVKVHAVPGERAIWFEHPTRVEPNLKHAWDMERLHLLPDGTLPSPGWMERQQEFVVEAYAPRVLEDEPLDKLECWERGLLHRLTAAKLEPQLQELAQQQAAKAKLFGAMEITVGAGSGNDDSGGSSDDDDEDEEEEVAGDGGFSMEEVAKHTTKGDCWVVIAGQVLNVTNFLSQHPGGELAILTFAGKDATEEFNMIHPPDVITKYAPDATIGKVGEANAPKAPKAKKAKKAKKGAGVSAAPVIGDKGDMFANFQAWGNYPGAENWRQQAYDHNPGVFLFNVKAYFHAFWSLWLVILYEVCATIFTTKNFKISNDRVGLTRSAIFLIFFIVIHGVGNLHVFMGPDDFNGYGYFYVRLYWTGFGLPANIVEEYIYLSILLHVFVGLKRTWDMKLALVKTQGLWAANLGISGVFLLTFMTIHLFQFRFGATREYFIRPPPCLISWYGLPHLNLFWTEDTNVAKVPVRDIYKLEFDLFNSYGSAWSGFYILSVCVFVFHACYGWQKAVASALGIPKLHQPTVNRMGYAIFFVLGFVYVSFPLFCMLTAESQGKELSLQAPHPQMFGGA